MGRPKELSEEERARLVASGFRPVEIWVPDRSSPAYRLEAARQARSAAEADLKDEGLDEWLEQVTGNLWDDDRP